MTVFVAVAALHLGHVLGLRALVRFMTFLIAVTAEQLLGFRTVTRRVALLTAVETASRTTSTALWTVPRKMAGCNELVSDHYLNTSWEMACFRRICDTPHLVLRHEVRGL
jgi:hypothetical protein